MGNETEHTSHGLKILVYRIEDPNHPYPWRFKIHHEGRWWTYAGVPNYCETRQAAIRRARRKCKSLRESIEWEKARRSKDRAARTQAITKSPLDDRLHAAHCEAALTRDFVSDLSGCPAAEQLDAIVSVWSKTRLKITDSTDSAAMKRTLLRIYADAMLSGLRQD